MEELRLLAIIVVLGMAVSALAGCILLALTIRTLRNLDIPPNASFTETLLLTPFSIVLAIDLLDLGLDILAAPLSWIILDRLGLKALRGAAAVEALIPGTQFIPTLTLCWLGVRIFGSRMQPFHQSSIGLERIAAKS